MKPDADKHRAHHLGSALPSPLSGGSRSVTTSSIRTVRLRGIDRSCLARTRALVVDRHHIPPPDQYASCKERVEWLAQHRSARHRRPGDRSSLPSDRHISPSLLLQISFTPILSFAVRPHERTRSYDGLHVPWRQQARRKYGRFDRRTTTQWQPQHGQSRHSSWKWCCCAGSEHQPRTYDDRAVWSIQG